ncbi:F-box/WD repeat-containing protein 9-like [Prorops nasuta]|uniref:F-box/WD repeat-containing protein 9-like n=1 Tax=Prorops nasuta TaxID=863751 RepID=UPI0034CD29AE
MMQDNDMCSQSSTQCVFMLDLPNEILLHICSFLDAKTLVNCLSLVCKKFYEILNDELFWKVRIGQICPNSVYPILPPVGNDEVFWKKSCSAIERQSYLWKTEGSYEKLVLTDVQYSTIDGLLLLKEGKICISGARDRSLVCWNISSSNGRRQRSCISFAHEGWIWDLTAINDTIYSCSWDQCIKAWHLGYTDLQHLETYKTFVSSALLCIDSCEETRLISTGSFCSAVLIYDSRGDGQTTIAKYYAHNGAVVDIAMNSTYIVTASEDKTVAIWDQRAQKTMKKIQISEACFPMSLCMKDNIVLIGDSNANITILDPRKNFEKVKHCQSSHGRGITGIHLSRGCLVTSSTDRTAKILTPTDPPQYITTVKCSYGEIAGIDFLNEVLAISGCEAIEIWRPKTDV